MVDESDLVAPTDPAAPIWRYMDFVRFAALLNSRALFFSRADRVNDSHEGSLPILNVKTRPGHLAKTIEIALKHFLRPTTAADILEKAREFDRAGPKRMYLNCWYMSTIESFEMWQVYGGPGQAIAIRSNRSEERR